MSVERRRLIRQLTNHICNLSPDCFQSDYQIQIKYLSRYAPKNPITSRPVMFLELYAYQGTPRNELVGYLSAECRQLKLADIMFDRLYITEDFEPFNRFRTEFNYPTEYKFWIPVVRYSSAHELLNAQQELMTWMTENTRVESQKLEKLIYE